MLQPLQIPKCCRQARSRKAHPPPRQGLSVGPSKCKNDAYNITTASRDQGSYDLVSGNRREMPEYSLFRCSIPGNEKHKGIIVESIGVPLIEVESATENASLGSSNNSLKFGAISNVHDHPIYMGRSLVVPTMANYLVKASRLNDLQLSGPVSTHTTVGSLPSTPNESMLPTDGSFHAWLVPGNVVWAKTAYHEWWPAEVMDEKGVLGCSNDEHIGHVLVKLYGNHEYAWLDPVGHLSQFDYCYDERSKNPLKAFQDALKQALGRHSRTSPRLPSAGCSGELKSSSQHDQAFDTCKTPSSSSTKDDCDDEGRGKRKRKLKIHFDDLTLPEKPVRRMRRLRIMRYLGLLAPVGSPFSVPHGRTTS